MKHFAYLLLLALASGCAHTDSPSVARKPRPPVDTQLAHGGSGPAVQLVPLSPYPYSATVASHLDRVRAEPSQVAETREQPDSPRADSQTPDWFAPDNFVTTAAAASSRREASPVGTPRDSLPAAVHKSDPIPAIPVGHAPPSRAQATDLNQPLPPAVESSSRRAVDLPSPAVTSKAVTSEAVTSETMTSETIGSSEEPVWTLESLEQMALTSNPSLAQLHAKVRAARGRWTQVGLRPNPVGGYSAQEIGNDNGQAGQHGIFFSQKFVRGNKLHLNREAAGWALERARQDLTAQQLRVLSDVRATYYQLLVAQERVTVAAELESIANEAVSKARELVKVQEPQSVLTQAEIEAELTGVMKANSVAQRDAAWRRLAAVIGQPNLPRQELTAAISSQMIALNWEETVERLRAESPELAAAASRVEEQRWKLQRACVEGIPDVTVQAGVFYDDSTSDPFATVQLSMPLPIYNWNQGGIAEARAEVTAAVSAEQRMELSLQSRLAEVFRQYEQAKQQAGRYENSILDKAKRNLELTRSSYAIGESGYLAVLTAQRSYSESRLAWLNALEALWAATVKIDSMLLEESL